jgi:selenocysteine lyase/cysteine desulfurase
MNAIETWRRDTPGCQTKIHFNNAGASLVPEPVLRATLDYLSLEAVTGGYETADLKADAIKGFYTSMARLLNTQPANLSFQSSATSAFAIAVSAIPFNSGDKILIAAEDYISNQIAFLSMQKRFGVELIRANSLPEGGVDVDHMRQLMDKHKPKLVSLTHVPTNTGLIQPVEAVGALCRDRDILYVVDACQSVGQLPLDVNKIHCDFLSGTFRKFLRGPRGTGFLFISDRILRGNFEPLFIDMRGAEWTDANEYERRPDGRRFEEWEMPYPLIVGCATAADYAMTVGLETIRDRNAALGNLVRNKITGIGLRLLDRGHKLSSIITVQIPGKESSFILNNLRKRNINTSIAQHSSAILDFDAKGVTWALRISPHYYNTEEEVDTLIQALKEVV